MTSCENYVTGIFAVFISVFSYYSDVIYLIDTLHVYFSFWTWAAHVTENDSYTLYILV